MQLNKVFVTCWVKQWLTWVHPWNGSQVCPAGYGCCSTTHQKMRTHVSCSSWMTQKEVWASSNSCTAKPWEELAPIEGTPLVKIMRSWKPCTQEGLDQVRRVTTKDKPKFKLVIKKPDPPVTPVVPPTKDASLRKRDWDKRTRKEWLAAHDQEKARSITTGNREYARLIEERQQSAEQSSESLKKWKE